MPVTGWGCDLRVGSRDRKCERITCLPLGRGIACCVASIISAMGREEAMMKERGRSTSGPGGPSGIEEGESKTSVVFTL